MGQQPHQPSQVQPSTLPTQTARHIRINARLPTPATTDCVAASGATADQAQDTVRIAARVETVGPREGDQVIINVTVLRLFFDKGKKKINPQQKKKKKKKKKK